MRDAFTCNFVAVVLVSLLFYVSCSRWHCAVVEIRSLVLARDDVSRALVRSELRKVKHEAWLH